MIDLIAGRMAASIKDKVPEHPASAAVLKYALALILNAVFIISISIAIGFATGHVGRVLIILISFSVLRQLSGGLHLKSGLKCIVVTTSGVTVLSLIQLTDKQTMILTGVALIFMVIWAPTNIEKQSRIPRKYYPFLKLLAVLLVSVNFIIGSDAVSLSFAAQGLTLIMGRR